MNDEKTLAENVDELITKIASEISEAHQSKYDIEKADRTAALCLEAQMKISEFLSEAEFSSKEKKAEVERLEAEKYFYYKAQPSDVKLTEKALEALVGRDSEVFEAKKNQYSAEADYRKWLNLLSILKDSHIFFRGIAKGKNEWS